MRIGGVNNMKKYKIAVAGTGYVGLSIATLLSQHHHETAVDIIPEKVEMINNRKSPIQDDYIEKYLAEKELNLTAKLIHVISGVLFDVALDLRENSPTFGQYHTELLKAEDQFVTYIPEGFAHGFISLTNDTIFSYQCSGRYVPSACGGIRWNDPELNIPWPLKEYGVEHIIATEKDKNWPTLSLQKHHSRASTQFSQI